MYGPLNDCIHTPWFALTSVGAMYRSLLSGYWCSGKGYGEKFLNFPLHALVQDYAYFDLTQLFPELADESGDVFGRWNQCTMGITFSSYACVQVSLRLKWKILGDRYNPNNPYQWSRVELNIPGTPSYDPTKSWIMKIRIDGAIATDLYIYVDDS